jgi:hypothetical protein
VSFHPLSSAPENSKSFLAVVLTGYEVVVTKSVDFNAVQHHWYDRFISPPKPGTLCDSYNLTVGELFSTNNHLLQYTLVSAGRGVPTISYSGQDFGLFNCDVSTFYIDADYRSRAVTVATYMACNTSSSFPIVAKTTYTISDFLTQSTLISSIQVGEVDLETHNNISISLP